MHAHVHVHACRSRRLDLASARSRHCMQHACINCRDASTACSHELPNHLARSIAGSINLEISSRSRARGARMPHACMRSRASQTRLVGSGDNPLQALALQHAIALACSCPHTRARAACCRYRPPRTRGPSTSPAPRPLPTATEPPPRAPRRPRAARRRRGGSARGWRPRPQTQARARKCARRAECGAHLARRHRPPPARPHTCASAR